MSIISAHFNIVDQVVAEIDSGWEIRRETHVAIDNEADVVGARTDVHHAFEISWLSGSSDC